MPLEEINADQFIQILGRIHAALEREKGQLSKLDSHIGDGDHGFGIANGFRIGFEKVAQIENCSIEEALKVMGAALIKEVGGASGTIFGSLFQGMAKAAKGRTEVTLSDFCSMLEQGLTLVQQRGHASPGDKTMVDALHPAIVSLKRSLSERESLSEAFRDAQAAARRGAEATINMIGKHGRAKYFREKSIGYQDAGATTVAVLLAAMSDVISEIQNSAAEAGGRV